MTLLSHFLHLTCSIYCLVMIYLGIVSDNQYHIFFLNTLLGNYRIVINFVHFFMITIWQENNFKTRKNNFEKYIPPLSRLIIMNIPNYFVKLVIGRNTDKFCREYSGLKNFPRLQVSVHPHEISSHSSLIYTKKTDFVYCETLDIWI